MSSTSANSGGVQESAWRKTGDLFGQDEDAPRQWGACWLGCQLWEQLGLGGFWRDKLTPGREGTRWDQVLQTLALYRLIDPGSEWRLHRPWFEHTAIADLLGGDFALAQIHRHLPTTDGREIVMARHTQPEQDLQLLLDQLKLELPEQGPPRIQALK